MSLRCRGEAGTPLRVEASASFQNSVLTAVVESFITLQPAQTKPLTPEILRQQFSRLGGTPFHLDSLESALGGVMLPLSELNRVRRALVEALLGKESEHRALRDRLRTSKVTVAAPSREEIAPTLSVLCRSLAQMEAALELGVQRVYVDFEDIRRYSDAVSVVRSMGPEVSVFLATPRIQKAGEAGLFKVIERAEPNGVLIRNLGGIRHFTQEGSLELVGDFSLNVANPLTAQFFHEAGLPRLTASYDLNVQQVLDLVRAAPPEWFELTLHQHIPMFHMEHCVFAAFMTKGTDFTNCGRPCEKHAVQLRDRVGQLHPLLADVGCRNTLYNGRAQTGARFYNDLRAAGLRHFRVELLREDPAATRAIISAYQSLLAGTESGPELWQKLHATNRLGVTGGTLETHSR